MREGGGKEKLPNPKIQISKGAVVSSALTAHPLTYSTT
jgi:hypothetical protein